MTAVSSTQHGWRRHFPAGLVIVANCTTTVRLRSNTRYSTRQPTHWISLPRTCRGQSTWMVISTFGSIVQTTRAPFSFLYSLCARRGTCAPEDSTRCHLHVLRPVASASWPSLMSYRQVIIDLGGRSKIMSHNPWVSCSGRHATVIVIGLYYDQFQSSDAAVDLAAVQTGSPAGGHHKLQMGAVSKTVNSVACSINQLNFCRLLARCRPPLCSSGHCGAAKRPTRRPERTKGESELVGCRQLRCCCCCICTPRHFKQRLLVLKCVAYSDLRSIMHIIQNFADLWNADERFFGQCKFIWKFIYLIYLFDEITKGSSLSWHVTTELASVISELQTE